MRCPHCTGFHFFAGQFLRCKTWVVSFPRKKGRITTFRATERDMAELVLEECRGHAHLCMDDLKRHVQEFRFLFQLNLLFDNFS